MVDTRNAKGKGVARSPSDAAATRARERTQDDVQQAQLNEQLYQPSGSNLQQPRVQELGDDDGDNGDELHGTPRAGSPGDASDPEGSEPPRRMDTPSRPGSAAAPRVGSAVPTQGRAPSGTPTVHSRASSLARAGQPLGNTPSSLHRGGRTDHSRLSGAYMAPPYAPPPSQSGQSFVQSLLQQKFAAEDAGATPEALATMQRRIEEASRVLIPTGHSSERARDPQADASKLVRTLNSISTKPKLGVEGRAPTPQQVHQWIKDVSSGFQAVQIVVESIPRTHWAMSTIQYSVHRELLQQKVTDGHITTWAELYTEELRLVQDPLLTRYQNYFSFWNFTFRANEPVNSFLLQLKKKETLLQRNFFKTLDGDDDDELKISFVWSKLPESYQREMKRHSLEAVSTWADFERALLNAESAVRIDSDSAASAPRGASGDGQGRSKRHASHGNNRFPGKKQDRRQSLASGSRDQSPANNAPPENQHASGSNAEQRSNRPWQNNQGGGGNQNGYQRNQKPHWKNKSDQQPPAGDAAGKDKP